MVDWKQLLTTTHKRKHWGHALNSLLHTFLPVTKETKKKKRVVFIPLVKLWLLLPQEHKRGEK